MVPLLVVGAILLAGAGLMELTQATFGVGLVGLGCLAGILARIAQASAAAAGPDDRWKKGNDERFAREQIAAVEAASGPSDLAKKANAETIAANLAGR